MPPLKESFEKAIELDPESIGGYMGRGMIRLMPLEMFGGDLDGAISDSQLILSKEPSNIDANFAMGLAYERKEQKDKAIDQFEKVLELNPQYEATRQKLEQLK